MGCPGRPTIYLAALITFRWLSQFRSRTAADCYSARARETEPVPEKYVRNQDMAPPFALHQAPVGQGFKRPFRCGVGPQSVSPAELLGQDLFIRTGQAERLQQTSLVCR